MTAVTPHHTPAPAVVDLSVAELRYRLHDALSVYVAAMEYPRGTENHRAPMWTEHTTRAGWQAVAAMLPDDDGHVDVRTAPLLAIAYGYRGAPHQWWHQQVHAGMRRCGWPEHSARELLADYFELTELHVHPSAQGLGIGGTLLHRLLEHRDERAVLLSTPEVAREENRAWRLYRRAGFTDVIRDFVFAGDTRPFAILGRRLPL
ncbi:GNAT family N-acetyltransferase [Nocardia farcinica]|uniref:Putative acetyltransferase n=1 Tax=Nocardia farcinica (strain IFM 10152) TaxID=247156 RepID=Q5YYZ1_NOCFA|nr:GNAT family N-acetyltransferase [Nocardia farcinica]MBA4859562.1 GNAT family N-acetyltransferase [Nocardia farcinica]MBC9817631.1 GNAT family N-acetyltransferase [Nocardia farcinica]MBF6071544.1 GNAT family N-acetyltransferase [Nocardia farcinica]MBF6142670.1 GNAT family N-acetyltransferase [Nocardia farcinica]MBF6231914.1 GNAT family N-acetyltransferase [Nocardia farcinica]